MAPDLFPYEVGNGLQMAVRRGRLGLDDARAASDSIDDLGVDLVRPSNARVFLVAAAFGITAYDAAYYVVAEGSVLWTGDENSPTRSPTRRRWPPPVP